MAAEDADTVVDQWALEFGLEKAHRDYIKKDVEDVLDIPNAAVRGPKLAALKKQVSQSKYALVKRVGQGAFGCVFKGYKRENKQTVAVKIIDLEDTQDDIMTIYREIMALSQGKICPQLTRYFDSVVQGTKLWIIMEYIDCGSVLSLLKKIQDVKGENAGLPEAAIAIIAREVLLGLRFLWSEKKMHRDIKCANILVTSTGQVKLADFGASRELTETSGNARTMIGSPYWMAPEILTGQDGYDYKADIWSLGITCLEMAMGHQPNHKVHPIRVGQLIVGGPPPKLEGEFSQTFKAFVSLCLNKDPTKRESIDGLLNTPFLKKSLRVEELPKLIDLGPTEELKS